MHGSPPPSRCVLQEVVRYVEQVILTPGHALRLKASQDLQDGAGTPRATGEEWLVRDIGAYLPNVFEEVCVCVCGGGGGGGGGINILTLKREEINFLS